MLSLLAAAVLQQIAVRMLDTTQRLHDTLPATIEAARDLMLRGRDGNRLNPTFLSHIPTRSRNDQNTPQLAKSRTRAASVIHS